MPQIEQKKFRFSSLLDKVEPVLMLLIVGGVLWYAYTSYVEPELHKYLPGGEFNVDSERVKLTEQEKYLKDLQDFYSLYQKKSQEKDILAGTVPNDPDLPVLFAGFEKIANEFKLGLEVIDIALPKVAEKKEKNETKGALKELTISVKFTKVDYGMLKTLLSVFESNKRIFDVQSLDADPASGSASFVMKTYYQEGKQ